MAMKFGNFLDDPRLLAIQSQVCKIMSNPRRVQILHLLDEKERSVGELVELTGLRKAAVSQNLALMRARNLVTYRRDGQKVIYKIKSKNLLAACRAMETLLLELVELGPGDDSPVE